MGWSKSRCAVGEDRSKWGGEDRSRGGVEEDKSRGGVGKDRSRWGGVRVGVDRSRCGKA